jgi:putative exporter of polyketide antibiotics
VTTWAGARTQGLDVGLADASLAGINVIPAALLALGIGALTLVLVPRYAAAVVYALVAGSLVIDLLGSLVSALHPLARVSLFHYVALAPAQSPSWTNVTAYLLLAAIACTVAIIALERRDLALD